MSDWIRIGVIGRPHGIKGALKVHLDNPDSDTLEKGLPVRLEHNGVVKDHVVALVGGGHVGFVGIADRTAAEPLVGALLLAQRADFDDDDDAVYLVDNVGKAVVDVAGNALGVIDGFSDNGAQALAEVKTPAGKIVLVPFVPPIVDSVGDKVVLRVPEGLFNLDDE